MVHKTTNIHRGVAILLLTCLLSCTYKHIQPEGSGLLEVNYTQNVLPVFENKCASCHHTSGVSPLLMGPNSYNSIISGGYINTSSAKDSKLIIKINGGHPQPGALSSIEEQTLLQWIEEGANNN